LEQQQPPAATIKMGKRKTKKDIQMVLQQIPIPPPPKEQQHIMSTNFTQIVKQIETPTIIEKPIEKVTKPRKSTAKPTENVKLIESPINNDISNKTSEITIIFSEQSYKADTESEPDVSESE
jgi:hypothetical protein